MKKPLLTLTLLGSFNLLAANAPISPMNNYEYTDINSNEAAQVWSSMKTTFEAGSECFNRAMSWTYDINKQFGIKSRKYLIHYSRKYNEELSSKWGFHIAPMMSVEGEDMVFDKGFGTFIHEPLSPAMCEDKFLGSGTDKLVEETVKLRKKRRDLKERLADLNKDSEFYWDSYQRIKGKIKEVNEELEYFGVTDEALKEMQPKKIAELELWIDYLEGEVKRAQTSQLRNRLKNNLKSKKSLLAKVKTDISYAAHIECKKIDSIEELDYNLKKHWCYVQEISMYYWGIPQLRLLNYGATDVPHSSTLPQAREEGAKHVREDFVMGQVWAARKQAFGRTSAKEIWAREHELNEKVEDIVRYNYKSINKIYKALNSMKKTKVKVDKLADKIWNGDKYSQQGDKLIAESETALQDALDAQIQIKVRNNNASYADQLKIVELMKVINNAVYTAEKRDEQMDSLRSRVKDL